MVESADLGEIFLACLKVFENGCIKIACQVISQLFVRLSDDLDPEVYKIYKQNKWKEANKALREY